jgi:Holliday junction resolvase RusA-like endonuclease
MPASYKAAQLEMRRQLKMQWTEGPLEGPISLAIKVKGEGRGDADNIAGAFMDSAQGIVLLDDRVSVVPVLSIEWQKASKAESEWIIEIRQL